MITVAVGVAIVIAVSLWLGLMVLIGRARRRDRDRLRQMLALCHAQQQWIRRGEVACVDCPELGACIVQGACDRES